MKTLFVMLTIIAFVASFAHALNEPEESLILYMSFDTIDGKNTIDHSKYENHGEMAGDPKHVDGKFGKALQLNGTSDWVVVPHHETLTVDKDVTVMAWINPERIAGPGGAQWQGILAKGNNPRSYSFYTETGKGCLHLSVGGAGSACDGKVVENEWQHVAAQVDGNTHRYWINGENVGEYGGKNAPPGQGDTANVFIGKTHEGSREFLGLIDEVRIWNRALTEDEVIDQMEKGHLDLLPVDPRQKLTTTWGTIKTEKK
ncbi:MAG: LamG domain-containing protein [Candidatus Poribacteria bacterium]|nr:LamG domain-containing protein [Candidatus Poribacteria bacterium]